MWWMSTVASNWEVHLSILVETRSTAGSVMKWTPNLALFAAPLAVPNLASFLLCTREPVLDSHAFPPPSPFTLLTSVFLMDQTYVKGTTHLRAKMASPLLLSQISCRGASNPISKPQL